MAKGRERDLNYRKSLLVLLKLVSLPGIFPRSFAVFISVLLFSSVVATPGRMCVSIAQQPAATSPDAVAAERIFQEGMQLYKQGTGESGVAE